MKIYIAADHAGFNLKNYLKKQLLADGYDIEDCGAFDFDPLDDYPDFIIPAAEKVANQSNSRGIIIGGSGQGEAMAANRIQGVRAAVYYDGPIDIVKLSRLHNNANILSLGARFLSVERATEILNIWLEEKFEGERHENRINKLDR
jgi:ribose 5-phosphate isomerase B